eukprot:11164651-Lingulodinium_polyedra.AAC.1
MARGNSRWFAAVRGGGLQCSAAVCGGLGGSRLLAAAAFCGCSRLLVGGCSRLFVAVRRGLRWFVVARGGA